MLGIIPELSGQRGVGSILAGRDSAAPGDSWRSLRTNFMYATSGRPVRSVTVTSLRPLEGKTTVAVDLAASVAELGLSVVLVDAAVRRPTLHEVFDLDNERVLTSALLNGADPASLLRPVPAMATSHEEPGEGSHHHPASEAAGPTVRP